MDERSQSLKLIIHDTPPRYYRSFNAGDEYHSIRRKKRALEFQSAVDEAALGVYLPERYYAVDVVVESPICKFNPRGTKLQNRIKTLFDALTRCGFWQDDKQVKSLTIREKIAPEKKTVVVVTPIAFKSGTQLERAIDYLNEHPSATFREIMSIGVTQSIAHLAMSKTGLGTYLRNVRDRNVAAGLDK